MGTGIGGFMQKRLMEIGHLAPHSKGQWNSSILKALWNYNNSGSSVCASIILHKALDRKHHRYSVIPHLPHNCLVVLQSGCGVMVQVWGLKRGQTGSNAHSGKSYWLTDWLRLIDLILACPPCKQAQGRLQGPVGPKNITVGDRLKTQ